MIHFNRDTFADSTVKLWKGRLHPWQVLFSQSPPVATKTSDIPTK